MRAKREMDRRGAGFWPALETETDASTSVREKEGDAGKGGSQG